MLPGIVGAAGFFASASVTPTLAEPFFVGSGKSTTTGIYSFSSLVDEAGEAPTLLEGDIVFCVIALAGNNYSQADLTPTGYTAAHTDLLSTDSTNCNFLVSYKVMGATPDTALPDTAFAYTRLIYVLRNIDTTTPLDVAVTTATGQNTAVFDCPSITPTTTGALIMAAGAAAGGTLQEHTNPSGFSTETNHFRTIDFDSAVDVSIATALQFGWTSGAVDPGTMGGAADAASSWCAATLALRPGTHDALPGTPGTPTATYVGGRQVQISFTPATQANSYEYRIDGGSWQALPLNRMITGLTTATEYDIEVRGVNAIGNGPASGILTQTTGPQLSYRYVLLEFVTTGNGWIGASTIKVFDSSSVDQALQANGGTASAIGYTVNASFPVTNVNDGNDTSFTTSSSGEAAGSGKGIQIDLGASIDLTDCIIGYRSRSDSYGANEAIRTGSIQMKVNSGDSFTTIQSIDVTGNLFTSNEYREFQL